MGYDRDTITRAALSARRLSRRGLGLSLCRRVKFTTALPLGVSLSQTPHRAQLDSRNAVGFTDFCVPLAPAFTIKQMSHFFTRQGTLMSALGLAVPTLTACEDARQRKRCSGKHAIAQINATCQATLKHRKSLAALSSCQHLSLYRPGHIPKTETEFGDTRHSIA